MRTIDHRQRAVESERKRLVEMQQVITVERLMILVSALVAIIQRHVTDRQTLSAITRDVDELLRKSSRPCGQPALPGEVN